MMDEEFIYNGQEYRTGNTYQNKKNRRIAEYTHYKLPVHKQIHFSLDLLRFLRNISIVLLIH